MSATPPVANVAHLRVVDGPLVSPVLTRVVGMLAARAQCPVDKLDDALLVADAVAASAPANSTDGALTVALRAGADRLELTVEGLKPDGGAAIVADATLPGVGNVLERIADEVRPEPGALVLSLRFGRPAETTVPSVS